MKTTELQLYDWIQTNNGSVSQVHRIEAGFVDFIEEKYFEPIPLTEDILDENKHKRLSISRWGMPTLVIDGDRYMLGDFHFVHELQQALRLCGLNDLADNFKIV